MVVYNKNTLLILSPMTFDPFFACGIVGMALILLCFFMSQSGRWSISSVRYDGLNFLGSVLLVIYAIPPLSWPFIILNGIWALVSLKDVFLDIQNYHMSKRKG